MKYFVVALFTVVSINCTYASDVSLDNGQELFEKCRAAERISDDEKNLTQSDLRKGDTCLTYIKGFDDGSVVTYTINAINHEKKSEYKRKMNNYKLYCTKNNTTIVDVVHAVIAHVRLNPNLRKKSARITLATALKKYFPCK